MKADVAKCFSPSTRPPLFIIRCETSLSQLSDTPTTTLSLSGAHTLANSRIHRFTPTLAHTPHSAHRTRTHAQTHTLSHSHTLSFTHSSSHSLINSLTRSLTRTHTHTHAHTDMARTTSRKQIPTEQLGNPPERGSADPHIHRHHPSSSRDTASSGGGSGGGGGGGMARGPTAF